MPRNYIRKTNRQSWLEINMKKAILDVSNGVSGFRKASQVHSVPKSTLEYRVKRYRDEKDLETASRKGLGRFKSVFNLEDEKILIGHIRFLDERLFTVTHKDIRCLAYEMADKYHFQHNFNDDIKLAGKDWLYSFLNRHTLRLRQGKPTLSDFFDFLESITDENDITAARIYSVGEIGISTAANIRSEIVRIIQLKPTVNAITTDGEKVTTILCFSATGHYVSPLFIFPRVQMKAELLVGFPADSVVVCHPTGLVQNEIWLEWLQHFISHVHPSKEQPVILLLDGHTTYSKSLQFLEHARDNGVILLSFPTESPYRIQPLDVNFVTPLSVNYAQEVDTWINNHPESVVTQYQVAELFGNAYMKTASLFNAVIGFKNSGIHPLNRHVHQKDDYEPSEITGWLLDQAQMNLALIKNEPEELLS